MPMAQVKLRLREIVEAAQKSVRSGPTGETGMYASGELGVVARADSGTNASAAQGIEEMDALNFSSAERLATSRPNGSNSGTEAIGGRRNSCIELQRCGEVGSVTAQ